MLTRREFLEVAGAGAAALLVPRIRAQAATPIDPSPVAAPGRALPHGPGGRPLPGGDLGILTTAPPRPPQANDRMGVQRLVPRADVRGSEEQADHGRVGQQSPFEAQTPAPAGHDDRR